MFKGLDITAKHYQDENAARKLLESIRWPEGPKCAHCGKTGAYALKSKPGSNHKLRDGVWKCKKCRKKFTVTVGTVFHRSHIPLNKWLLAFALICSSKKGISAHQMHRMLSVDYKTAWFLCHRVRFAMERGAFDTAKLDGVVEADETHVGGKRKGGKRGRPGVDSHKTPFFPWSSAGAASAPASWTG